MFVPPRIFFSEAELFCFLNHNLLWHSDKNTGAISAFGQTLAVLLNLRYGLSLSPLTLPSISTLLLFGLPLPFQPTVIAHRSHLLWFEHIRPVPCKNNLSSGLPNFQCHPVQGHPIAFHRAVGGQVGVIIVELLRFCCLTLMSTTHSHTSLVVYFLGHRLVADMAHGYILAFNQIESNCRIT